MHAPCEVPFAAVSLADLIIVDDGPADSSGTTVVCIGVPDLPLAHMYQHFLMARSCDADVMVCVYNMEDWAATFPGGTAQFFESMLQHGHPPVDHAVRVYLE
jgi:hypothetical protein